MINHVVHFDLKTGFVNRVSLSNGTLMLKQVNKKAPQDITGYSSVLNN